jgi:hypothetical protein
LAQVKHLGLMVEQATQTPAFMKYPVRQELQRVPLCPTAQEPQVGPVNPVAQREQVVPSAHRAQLGLIVVQDVQMPEAEKCPRAQSAQLRPVYPAAQTEQVLPPHLGAHSGQKVWLVHCRQLGLMVVQRAQVKGEAEEA